MPAVSEKKTTVASVGFTFSLAELAFYFQRIKSRGKGGEKMTE